MPTGTLLKWYQDKGYGYIKPHDSSPDCYVQFAQLASKGSEAKTPFEGACVEYEVEDNPRQTYPTAKSWRITPTRDAGRWSSDPLAEFAASAPPGFATNTHADIGYAADSHADSGYPLEHIASAQASQGNSLAQSGYPLAQVAASARPEARHLIAQHTAAAEDAGYPPPVQTTASTHPDSSDPLAEFAASARPALADSTSTMYPAQHFAGTGTDQTNYSQSDPGPWSDSGQIAGTGYFDSSSTHKQPTDGAPFGCNKGMAFSADAFSSYGNNTQHPSGDAHVQFNVGAWQNESIPIGIQPGHEMLPIGAPSSGEKTGTLMRWKAEKGFGFIKPDDGGESFFAHVRQLTLVQGATVGEGSRVSYEVEMDAKQDKKRARSWSLLQPEGDSATMPPALDGVRTLPESDIVSSTLRPQVIGQSTLNPAPFTRVLPTPPPAPMQTVTLEVEVPGKYVNEVIGPGLTGLDEIKQRAGGNVIFEVSEGKTGEARQLKVIGPDVVAGLGLSLVLEKLVQLV